MIWKAKESSAAFNGVPFIMHLAHPTRPLTRLVSRSPLRQSRNHLHPIKPNCHSLRQIGCPVPVPVRLRPLRNPDLSAPRLLHLPLFEMPRPIRLNPCHLCCLRTLYLTRRRSTAGSLLAAFERREYGRLLLQSNVRRARHSRLGEKG